MNGNKKFVGDRFAQFFYFWICFNAWLAYRSGITSDREMIEYLATEDPRMEDLINAYNRARQNKEKIFMNAINHLSVITKEDPKRIQLKDKSGVWQPVVVDNESDFANIVRAIYGIRCGLFHGRMDINDGENEARVNSARSILDTWIEYLIQGWKR